MNALQFRRLVYNKQVAGFTLIQAMVSLALAGILTTGLVSFIRKNKNSIYDNELLYRMQSAKDSVKKMLEHDIEQAVLISPGCGRHAMAVPCSAIPTKSGIIPLTGQTLANINNFTTVNYPPVLDQVKNPTPGPGPNDALRLIVYDFDPANTSSFACHLAKRRQAFENPTLGAPDLIVDEEQDPQCFANGGILKTGGLYVLAEGGEVSGTNPIRSTLFQITSIDSCACSSDPFGRDLSNNDLVRVNAIRAGSFLNVETGPSGKIYGFADSGFTDQARIMPVKIVEWALDNSKHELKRREIYGGSSGLVVGDWVSVGFAIERFQFQPFSMAKNPSNPAAPFTADHVSRVINATTDPSMQSYFDVTMLDHTGAAVNRLDEGLRHIVGGTIVYTVRSQKQSLVGAKAAQTAGFASADDGYFHQDVNFKIFMRNILN